MKNERILLVEDDSDSLELTNQVIKILGHKDGHWVIASASTINEVRVLMEGGLTPTVAIIDDHLPNPGDGGIAANIIRKHSPATIIVSYSGTREIIWSDRNWPRADMNPQKLIDALTNLKH